MNHIFKFQEKNISILGTVDEPLFFGSQVARILGYVNAFDAMNKHVWAKNKISIKDYVLKNPDTKTLWSEKLNNSTMLINEPGMYQLIFKSKLEKAQEFQDFVFSEVLPSIRKNGSFQIPKLVNNQFLMLNERNLHEKVVDYLRKYFPDVLFNASLGEFQDTILKRKMGYKLGYSAGMVDLMIYEHSKDFNGLAIEFKSPNGLGVISEKQENIKIKLEERSYKYILSDNYDDIIIELNKYLSNRRYKCYHCRLKFKSLDTISTHLRVIHRK
jgi:anti-repressor protein